MAWIKKGLIFSVDNLTPIMRTHTLAPTPLILGDSIRIFFSSRNEKNQSYPFYLDVSSKNPKEIKYIHKTPLFELGELGAFDDDGIMPCSVVRISDKLIYLYYIGWNRGVTVSYRNSIGLAVSNDNGETFERMFRGPIIDRHKQEPQMAASPCVMRDGDNWHCWYTSGTRWITVNGKTEPIYTIRYAHSSNGIDWMRDGKECMSPNTEFEAFARPAVIKTEQGYLMWYNYRDSFDYRDGVGSYQIGFAESYNGREWVRNDSVAGITRSAEGWDSLMQCYPAVLECGEFLYLFYNGNGFGKSGLGYAQYEKD